MNNLKLSFLILFILFFFVRTVYKRRNDKKSKVKKNYSRFGFLSFFLMMNFVGMMALPLFIVVTPYLDKFSLGIPSKVRIVSYIIAFLNILLFWKTHHDLGLNWGMALQLKEKHKLIQTGVYRYIRHPMYTSFWILVITQGIILDNLVLLFFGVGIWGTLYFIRVPKEEKMMEGEFGEEYRIYMKKTGRILPKLF